MRSDLTDITLVVDRSGSMEKIREDAEGGVNTFIQEQAKHPGEALLTLVQFDTEYEFVHRGMPIKQVPPYTLVPRGNTALLDAVGRAINETGERLAKMAEEDRPGLVVFVITTDGLENSSKEFSKAQIKELIERQQSAYKWQFIFLGPIRMRSRKPEAWESAILGRPTTLRTKFKPPGVPLPPTSAACVSSVATRKPWRTSSLTRNERT